VVRGKHLDLILWSICVFALRDIAHNGLSRFSARRALDSVSETERLEHTLEHTPPVVP